ncbi:MAG: ABC transporter permease, partial [Bauldia litoralis]
RQFVDIELPLLKPGITASVFFSFLLSFNELPRTLYTRGGITTLPYYIWTASAAHSSQVSLIYALSAIIMAASFVLILIATRILMRSN